MANNQCGAKSANVPYTKHPPRESGPFFIADLDAYNLSIHRADAEVEYFGKGFANVDITLNIRPKTLHSIDESIEHIPRSGSDVLKDFETFVEDIQVLDAIKMSKQAGVQDLWGQLNTLLALTNETDK